MRSAVSRLALVVCLGLPIATPAVWAQPRNKKPVSEAGADKSLDHQSAWEQKVMGDDGAKKADMKRIAAAQRLSDEARKNPPPEPAKKYKDPNKEGARAKNEAAIGLPIASDQTPKAHAQKPPTAKKAAPANSANDELGALVATSLAENQKPSSAAPASPPEPTKSRRSKGKSRKGRPESKPEAPSSLDRMFSASH